MVPPSTRHESVFTRRSAEVDCLDVESTMRERVIYAIVMTLGTPLVWVLSGYQAFQERREARAAMKDEDVSALGIGIVGTATVIAVATLVFTYWR